MITIDSRLVPLLEILAADGEVLHYSVRRAEAGLDQWAVDLARTDGEGTYRVSLGATGKWRCTCPDWRYRRRKDIRGCKHTSEIQALKRLAEELAA